MGGSSRNEGNADMGGNPGPCGGPYKMEFGTAHCMAGETKTGANWTRFEPAEHRRHLWLRDFTTQTYIDELNTYSAKLVLSEENREALLSCIRAMIDGRYGGRITKAYLTDLHVARRV